MIVKKSTKIIKIQISRKKSFEKCSKCSILTLLSFVEIFHVFVVVFSSAAICTPPIFKINNYIAM